MVHAGKRDRHVVQLPKKVGIFEIDLLCILTAGVRLKIPEFRHGTPLDRLPTRTAAIFVTET